MSAEVFTQLVAECADDDELITKMKEHISQQKKG